MKTLHKNKNGFSFVELIIVMLVISAIFLAGVYVYYKTTKSNSSSKSSVSTSIYKGWNLFVSKNQQLHIKYPSNWQLMDISTSGNDSFSVKSPNGLTLTFYTTYAGGPFAAIPGLIASSPINFINKSDYLLYYSANGSKSGTIESVVLSSSSNSVVLPEFSKNQGWAVTIGFQAIYGSTNLPNTQSSSDFKNAVSIIESAAY